MHGVISFRFPDCGSRPKFEFNVALVHREDYLRRGAQDGHLDFHTAPELWGPKPLRTVHTAVTSKSFVSKEFKIHVKKHAVLQQTVPSAVYCYTVTAVLASGSRW